MKKTDSEVAAMIEATQPDWEYVGGYTGIDGRFYLKHKVCGSVYEKSVSSVRHGKNPRCRYCNDIDRKKRRQEKDKERRRIARIWKEFNKPVHAEQLQAKACLECGALFIGKRDYCSDCIEMARKRYDNRRKELKRKGSHTEQSKEINAYSIYKKENGRCWLCGGQCDINADPNSNYYPSVDHILPQSLGGKDTWENVHCAHRICNTLRSNRVNFNEPTTAILPQV